MGLSVLLRDLMDFSDFLVYLCLRTMTCCDEKATTLLAAATFYVKTVWRQYPVDAPSQLTFAGSLAAHPAIAEATESAKDTGAGCSGAGPEDETRL